MANEQDPQRGNPSRGATQAARDIGQAAVETFHEYSEQATQTYEQSREQVNHWIDDLRQRATDEPVKTVLMAAGVGIVLGVLFG
jgi:ElaB/YqjD/DUF883 family membrane-anchored ribosome-binding protein